MKQLPACLHRVGSRDKAYFPNTPYVSICTVHLNPFIFSLSLSLSIAVRSPGPWFILASVLQIYCPLGKGFYVWILRLECQPKSFRKLQRTKIPRWDVVNIAKVGGKPVINSCWYLLDDSQLLPSNNLYICNICNIHMIKHDKPLKQIAMEVAIFKPSKSWK